jgi:S-DNA-T family DNA segregation ATPase FtsK/SpoIIIE
VTALVTGAVGALDVVVPVFLFWATLRVLRHPDEGSMTGRLAIGTGILLASACGIWSLAKGAPSPSDGTEAMRAAGGWVGWLVTAPIVSAVGIWLAYLWLGVLLGFGVLIVTATPIHAVPERLGALRDGLLLRRTPEAPAGEGQPPTGDMAVDGRAKHAALAQDPDPEAPTEDRADVAVADAPAAGGKPSGAGA